MVRIAVERFDWKKRAALCKKGRKSWDAVRQMIHYRDVVGEDAAILTQTPESGDSFRDASRPLEEAVEAKLCVRSHDVVSK